MRPKDAASLVLVDRSAGQPRFLMGVRAAGLVFMPGHLVFPGGRLDPIDLRIANDFPIHADATRRLIAGTARSFSPRRATALALAAIRETQEETGLLVGKAGLFDHAIPAWLPFSRSRIRPTPEALVPLARALTPTGQPRRFDARFFLADATAAQGFDGTIEPPTDELERIVWVDASGLEGFRVAPITRFVIDAALRRLAEGTDRDPSHPIPFHRYRHGRATTEFL